MSGSRNLLVAALLPIALLFGCSSANSGDESGVPVSFTVISSGFNLTVGTNDPKLFETFQDQSSYDNALNTYSLRVDGEVIDFTSNQVVLISTGSRSSGGYGITTQSVRDAGDYIELSILLSSAGAGCVVITAFTHPYQVLKINSLKEVRTIERNVTESCG